MPDSDSQSRREPGPSAYLLREVVAEGGHGEIWQAIQVSLKRVVAVKRVHRKWYEERDVERVRLLDASFRKEALVTSRLDHPNIVPVYDFGADREGHPLIAMKLVEGCQWSGMIQDDRGNLDPPAYLARHLAILISVAHAVGFAHSRGVIHRDLKPSQVMVGKFGEVFLMDWGLAVVIEERPPTSAAAGLTMPITLKDAINPAGTSAYMAPEQTEATAARLGPWTDIWLLGGLLYSILTGTRPYSDEDAHAAMAKARVGIVEPPEQRAPDFPVPPDLSRLCMRALSREIGDRPASVQEFIRGIEDYLSGASRRDEARRLADEAGAAIRAGIGTYEELSACDNKLTRACNLWPEHAESRDLHQRLLGTFARSAVENGDLGLARVQAGRLSNAAERTGLESRIDEKARMLRRQAAERRFAIVACFVLLLVSGALGQLLITRAARARVAAEQARAEEIRKQGEITRARERAEASAEQARRAREVSSLYEAEAQLGHEIAQDWFQQYGVVPTLEWTPYDRNAWAHADQVRAARLQAEVDDWASTRSRLADRGERLGPLPFSLSFAAGTMALYAAAGTTDTRRASEHFRQAALGGREYYRARIAMAAAAFRSGDIPQARSLLESAGVDAIHRGGFRGDYQKALILVRETLVRQSQETKLPPGSVIVESRTEGRNAGHYEEVSGGPWRDTNKPAEWAKSVAPGTTVDQPIGSRTVRFYSGAGPIKAELPAAARFHPHLDRPGRYHVYVTWPIAASAFPVICSVRHSGGETSISLVQDGWGFQGSSNANLWTDLGEYALSAGDEQWAEVYAPREVKPASRVWNGQLGVDSVLFSPRAIESGTTQPRAVGPGADEQRDRLGWYYDINGARQVAGNAGKRLFVFLGGGSLEVNHYYADVFSDPQVRRTINRSYIPVSIRAYGNTETGWAYPNLSPGTALILDAAGRQQAKIKPADVMAKQRLLKILGEEDSADVQAR